MNIAILGAGAMGMLFGGYLSRSNNVWLIDINRERVETIMAEGLVVRESDGSEQRFHPRAVLSADGLPQMDLILLFVKAMHTEQALETNRCLIGPDTYLMTLQNGVGHEAKLLRFADGHHVIIGSTRHNSSILSMTHVHHGGGGETAIGLLDGDGACLQAIADSFCACGFDCRVCDEVKQQIWSKLFVNTAASSLTAILQAPLGFILDDPYACGMMERLAREAVAVANAGGPAWFDEETVIADIKALLGNAKDGYTSIYADLKNGVRTEVDSISGAVVGAAHALGMSVPCHEMVVSLVHAMENRAAIVPAGTAAGKESK